MKNIQKFKKASFIIIFIWFTAIIISMLFNISNVTKKQDKLVLEHAKNAFEKDLMFRKWVASHGGVYVFPTQKTPPNPYLSHIPDRDLTTTDGRKLTLMNPAYTLRELMENFSGMYGEKGHITSLNLLNPNNKPDKWEVKVLKNFDKKLFTEYHEIYNYKGKEHLRYMKALVTKPDCLKCHAKQGYKVGDVRGGVSITIPMEKYNNDGAIEKKFIILIHISILLLSIILALIIYKRVLTSIKNEIAQAKELKRKEKVLNQQARMASLGEMLANIAHQWRQPLSIISTCASGLKLHKELNTLDKETLYSSANGILNSTQYLSQTIDDFSNFIKDNKERVEFSLEENIEKNLKILQGNIKAHDIKIILDLEKDIMLKSYPNELTQVFINIINNSKDAFKENKIEDRYIFIKTRKKNKHITIKIKDNANGIEKDILPKIFEPYFSTKHSSQGTGLGLYMSHKIVTQSMGGTIHAKNISFIYNNTTYTGAKFIIDLPILK